MKKICKYFTLLVVLSALLCLSAYAADSDVAVFEPNVSGAVASEATAEKFKLTYTGVTNGRYLVLMVTEDQYGDYTINQSSIQYVDQTEATASGVSFTIYPKEMVDAAILLAGGNKIETLGYVKVPKPAGVEVSGTVQGYNGSNAPVVKLYAATDTAHANALYTATVSAAVESGNQYEWDFSFEAVAEGKYDLVVTKTGHLAYTITDVEVGSESIDLTEADGEKYQTIEMLCGDIDGDDSINPSDINVIYQANNYYKSVSNAADSEADLDGDGSVNPSDINVIYEAKNYYKGIADCTVPY